jgi:hypothetical protein
MSHQRYELWCTLSILIPGLTYEALNRPTRVQPTGQGMRRGASAVDV